MGKLPWAGTSSTYLCWPRAKLSQGATNMKKRSRARTLPIAKIDDFIIEFNFIAATKFGTHRCNAAAPSYRATLRNNVRGHRVPAYATRLPRIDWRVDSLPPRYLR